MDIITLCWVMPHVGADMAQHLTNLGCTLLGVESRLGLITALGPEEEFPVHVGLVAVYSCKIHFFFANVAAGPRSLGKAQMVQHIWLRN